MMPSPNHCLLDDLEFVVLQLFLLSLQVPISAIQLCITDQTFKSTILLLLFYGLVTIIFFDYSMNETVFDCLTNENYSM